MNRIEAKFNQLKKNNEKALITYITAGSPSLQCTEELIYAQERAGAAIVEIGIPFSDALADGPIIQKAAEDALRKGTTVKGIFEVIKKARKNTEVPLVFLVYYNTLLAYGVEKFVNNCCEFGIDGLIIPDLPYEEQHEVTQFLEDKELALIPLVAPTSEDRISKIVENKKGFVYCVSSLGVTGMKDGFYGDVEAYLKTVKELADIPIAVGFGVGSKADVEKFAPHVDAVIVGTAIVKLVNETEGNAEKLIEFIEELKDGLK
jgi:tryptophan synthase alpha chain